MNTNHLLSHYCNGIGSSSVRFKSPAQAILTIFLRPFLELRTAPFSGQSIPTVLFAPSKPLGNVLLPCQIELPGNLVTNFSSLHYAKMIHCSSDSCIIHDASQQVWAASTNNLSWFIFFSWVESKPFLQKWTSKKKAKEINRLQLSLPRFGNIKVKHLAT